MGDGDNGQRGWNPQVLAALIAVSGVMFTAVLTNWDKLFGPAAPATASAAPPPVNATEAKAEPTSTPHAETTTVAVNDAPVIDGLWSDTDGYSYRVQQSGPNIRYTQLQNGQPVGQGEGTIEGRTLRYTYAAADGNGSCRGDLSADGQRIAGRCTDAGDGSNWPFAITR